MCNSSQQILCDLTTFRLSLRIARWQFLRVSQCHGIVCTREDRLTQHKSATESLILRFRRLSQPKSCLVRLLRKSNFSSGTKPPADHGVTMTLTESSTKGCCKTCSMAPRTWCSLLFLVRCKKIGRSRWIGTLPDAMDGIGKDEDVKRRGYDPVMSLTAFGAH
jgi:hypothetical protein